MKIIQAAKEDIKALYAMQKLAFESEAAMIGSREVPALQETAAHFRSDFPHWTTLKAVDERGSLCGAIRFREDGSIIDVGRLMVHPRCRRQGLAKALLASVDKAFPSTVKELCTCTRSQANIRLYEQVGYRPAKTVTEESGLSFVYMRK